MRDSPACRKRRAAAQAACSAPKTKMRPSQDGLDRGTSGTNSHDRLPDQQARCFPRHCRHGHRPSRIARARLLARSATDVPGRCDAALRQRSARHPADHRLHGPAEGSCQPGLPCRDGPRGSRRRDRTEAVSRNGVTSALDAAPPVERRFPAIDAIVMLGPKRAGAAEMAATGLTVEGLAAGGAEKTRLRSLFRMSASALLAAGLLSPAGLAQQAGAGFPEGGISPAAATSSATRTSIATATR